MSSFYELSKSEKNPHHKKVFEILAKHENDVAVNDGANEITLDTGELEFIRDELYSNVRESLGEVQSAREMRESLLYKLPQQIMRNAQGAQQVVADGYANYASGIGTSIDTGMATESFVPVSMSPQEATAYYASGGLPARIINKKAGSIALDGVHFECSSLNAGDLQRLDDYAVACGFSQAYLDVVTQSLIFGGALAYPVFKFDNPLSFLDGKNKLKELSAGRDNFISHWVVTDRWNSVFVPNYNVTAQDYLYARSLFIPIGGVRVSTDRIAMVKPSKLPFWGAIQQMGWSTSDFEGWIKDYEAYVIMVKSLPVMAQQNSLMYHSIPADSIIVENGVDYAKKFFKENEAQMREWSMLRPRAINSVGEIKILERTYSGYRDLVKEAAVSLCANSGIPESMLFGEKATGLASDNKIDVTLKQSEMARLLFNNISPSLNNCIEWLVYSCFGVDSPQATYAKTVKIKADSGFVLSDMDKAQLGASFVQILGGLVGTGVPFEQAIETARGFVPSAEISGGLLESIIAGESEGISDGLWESINAARSL